MGADVIGAVGADDKEAKQIAAIGVGAASAMTDYNAQNPNSKPPPQRSVKESPRLTGDPLPTCFVVVPVRCVRCTTGQRQMPAGALAPMIRAPCPHVRMVRLGNALQLHLSVLHGGHPSNSCLVPLLSLLFGFGCAQDRRSQGLQCVVVQGFLQGV